MDFKFHVLNKLFRKRCWGGKHKMNEDILAKGAPRAFKKEILHMADKLTRDGYLCLEGGGLHGKGFFLNRNMKQEIIEYLEEKKNSI